MYETDSELLAGCREGDARAWQQLLDNYERLVYSIPLNYGLTVADAADIAQVTFTIFLQSMNALDDDSNLTAWLATVARRHSWRLLEQRRREEVGTSGDLSEALYAIPSHATRRQLEHDELVEWLVQGMRGLDDRCRELLQSLYFSPQSPSYAEVARQFGIAEGSVGPIRARCLERLRVLLDEAL